ncbi:MAG: dimethyl sulfoxide reductase anchor subunit [Chloroflexi bacterium]|nr:dimethyl sulfoxide reductase anchor subunit [Chloroflexota bacterium]
MQTAEWALVIYTILIQMAVGAFLILGAMHVLAYRKAGAEEADRLSARALYAIGPVVVIGVLASMLHLGNPLNSYKVLSNIGSSWLSREIAMTILFGGLGAVFALLQWRKIGSFAVRTVVAVLTAIAGIGLVFSMSQIYMLPTQPAWNTFGTPVQFFTTALLLGSLAGGAALVANYAYLRSRGEGACLETQGELLCTSIRWIVILAVALLGVELIVFPITIAYLAAGPVEAVQSAAKLFGEFGVLTVLRVLLVFVGAGVFGLFLYRRLRDNSPENFPAALVYGAFALVLIGEVVGRFLFYATHVGINIGV